MGINCRALGLLCLLLLAGAVKPAEASRWRRIVDAIVPEGIREWFGGSPPDQPEDEGLPLLSEADILKLEEPKEGNVAAGEAHVYRMSFPPNGEDFPNIYFTLSVINNDGDADIYCIPEQLFKTIGRLPNPKFSIWKSDHTEGADHIFISRDHELYELSKYGLHENGEIAEGVAFVCTVIGYSASGTDYLLEVEVEYTDISLVDEEQEAMEDIFDQCCLSSPDSCLPWKSSTKEDGSVSMDFCHIPGNVCNPDGRLIRLDLSRLDMTCEFPMAAIAKMKNLEKLDLSKNMIEGDISEIMESLRMKSDSLEYVNFNENALEGSLSDELMGVVPVCELTQNGRLAFLSLSNNTITGELPGCLFDASSSLKELALQGANLEGSIPEISVDSPLQILQLKDCGLSGKIPQSLGELKSLVSIDLSHNSLKGNIPKSLGSASTLVSVKLHNNNLGGSVPGALTRAENLGLVELNENELESFAPGWYKPGGMTSSKLQVLDVGRNSIEGQFPTALTSAPMLKLLSLQYNMLTGPLPNDPGMFPQTVVFFLSNNKFSGEIPSLLEDTGFFSSEVRIRTVIFPKLDLSNNMLEGEIPEFLHSTSVPEYLWDGIRLGGNNFNLPCPLELAFIHVADLKCANGESDIDSTPNPVETAEGLRENPLFEEDSAAVVPGSDEPAVAPSEEPADAPASGPSAEDVELAEIELASADRTDRGIDLLARSKQGSIRSTSGEVESSDEEPEQQRRTSGRKGSTARSPFIFVGAAFLLVVVAAIVVFAAIRKHKKKKDAVVDEVVDMDLEMQTAPTADDDDQTHMLNGVKPSAAM